LTSVGYFGPRVGIGSEYRSRGRGTVRGPIPLLPRARTGTGAFRQNPSLYPNDPYSVRTVAGQVPVYDVRAERDRDGFLQVVATSETPTNGWRIYTHHEIRPSDTLSIRLRGVPPSAYGTRQISHPSAPVICVEDRNSAIRRLVVRGSNGERHLTIGPGATSAQP